MKKILFLMLLFAIVGIGESIKAFGDARVRIPADEYKELVERAQKHKKKMSNKPVVMGTLQLDGRQENGGYIFTAILPLDIPDSASPFPLRFSDSTLAILSATSDMKDVPVYISDGKILILLGKGAHNLQIKFVSKTQTDEGVSRIKLCGFPKVPISVNMSPPYDNCGITVITENEKRSLESRDLLLRGSFHASGALTFCWQEKPAAKIPPKKAAKSASLTTSAFMRSRGITATTTFDLLLINGIEKDFIVEFPAGVEVKEVKCLRVFHSKTNKRQDKTTLEISCSEAFSGKFSFEVEWYCEYAETVTECQLPFPAVADSKFDSGIFLLGSSNDLELSCGKIKRARKIDLDSLQENGGISTEAYLYGFSYAANPEIEIIIDRHKPVDTLKSVIDTAVYFTVVSDSGRSFSRGLFAVKNTAAPFLGVYLPSGSMLASALVDGEPVKIYTDSSGRYKIPLTVGDAKKTSYPVEIVFVSAIEKTSDFKIGTLSSRLPKLTIPVSALRCYLYLPEDLRCETFTGNVVRVTRFCDFDSDKLFAPPKDPSAQPETIGDWAPILEEMLKLQKEAIEATKTTFQIKNNRKKRKQIQKVILPKQNRITELAEMLYDNAKAESMNVFESELDIVKVNSEDVAVSLSEEPLDKLVLDIQQDIVNSLALLRNCYKESKKTLGVPMAKKQERSAPAPIAPLSELILIKYKQLGINLNLNKFDFESDDRVDLLKLARFRKKQDQLAKYTLDLSNAMKADSDEKRVLEELAKEMFSVCKRLDERGDKQITKLKLQKTVKMLDYIIKQAQSKSDTGHKSREAIPDGSMKLINSIIPDLAKHEKLLSTTDSENKNGLLRANRELEQMIVDMRKMLAEMQGKGQIPISFFLPAKGKAYTFEKILVVDEAPHLNINWTKR